MKDNRMNFNGMSPFASAEPWGHAFGTRDASIVSRKGGDEIGAGLRAAYAELLEAPLPERFVRLLEQLDASGRDEAR